MDIQRTLEEEILYLRGTNLQLQSDNTVYERVIGELAQQVEAMQAQLSMFQSAIPADQLISVEEFGNVIDVEESTVASED